MMGLLRYWDGNKTLIPWAQDDLHASVCTRSDGDFVSLSHGLLTIYKPSLSPSLFLSLIHTHLRFTEGNEKLMKLDLNFFGEPLSSRSQRNRGRRLVSIEAVLTDGWIQTPFHHMWRE